MALTYSDVNTSIMENNWFRNRVRVSISTYANYLLNTGAEDAEYEAKVTTGQRIISGIDQAVQTILASLIGDVEIQGVGPTIPDNTLQMIVEKTVKKFYPVQPAAPSPQAGMGSYPLRPPM